MENMDNLPQGVNDILRAAAAQAIASKQPVIGDTKAPGDNQRTPGVDYSGITPWSRMKHGDKLPVRRYQEYLDVQDPHKGKGTDLIRYAEIIYSGKAAGYSPEKALEASGDERMIAAHKTAQAYAGQLSGARTKALAESTMIDGGALIPPEFSSEFLFLLRNSTVVLESGARVIEMASPVLNMGRQNAAGTAYYVGENQAITASQQQFGQLAFSAKKLTALTPFSNDFLRDGGPAAEQKVRDDLVAVLGLKQDLTWLRGDGTQGACKGILNLLNSAALSNATQAGVTATFQEISGDAGTMITSLEAHNILKAAPANTWGWVMHPRSKQYLQTVSSSFGVYPFRDEMVSRGTFFGYPFKVTAAIPTTLGSGGNASEVYLVAWPTAMIGMNLALEVALFPNGTAPDVGGTIVSGIANDMSWIRAITKHDFQMAYDFGGYVLQNVLWGA